MKHFKDILSSKIEKENKKTREIALIVKYQSKTVAILQKACTFAKQIILFKKNVKYIYHVELVN